MTPAKLIMKNILYSLGRWCRFVGAAAHWSVKPPYRIHHFFKQMEFIGVKSTPIITLTGVFVGMVFALQAGKTFALFNMEVMVGSTVGLSLTREIAPVFAALMVTARACSAMAAEIGTMRVTEQIDALAAMAVDPIQYLVAPRLWGCVLMIPILTMVFNFVGILGAYGISMVLLDIPEGPFLHYLYWYVDVDDVISGLMKAGVFGFFVAAISCYQGFYCEGGAEGVGRATTKAVVTSSVTVLVLDYFLTTWLLEFVIKQR